MKIIDGLKLDFKDVLILPKRSKAVSRSEVVVTRKFKNKLGKDIEVVPIIAANMDTVATFDMAVALAKHGCMTALHKHYTVEEYVEFFTKNQDISKYVFYSLGINEKDIEKLKAVQNVCGENISAICIDVANGYTDHFVEKVKRIIAQVGSKFIMAGNVVTPNMVEELIMAGVDLVKVGIGPGCFVVGTPVITDCGKKPIEKVNVGDKVITHRGRYKKVIGKMKRQENKRIYIINGIRCTEKHEFYVVHKRDIDKARENLEKYAIWLPADELTKDYVLVKYEEK